MQDTIRQKILTGTDTLARSQVKDSVRSDAAKISTVKYNPVILKPEIKDTVTDCTRNRFADVTFWDSASSVRTIRDGEPTPFPYNFLAQNRDLYSRNHQILISSLKEGDKMPGEQFRADWIVPLLIFSAFLLGIVRSVPGNFFRNMFRFLFMRGVNENASRDTGTLFQWQSTLMNLSAFISVSLFCYLMLRHYDISIPGISKPVLWLICLGGVIVAVTLRHFVCNITGNVSDQTEIFREYTICIYQVYRFGGIIFMILSILILYMVSVPAQVWFTAGIAITGLLYLLRVIRLLLIFITRRVSILYLILYLCALEILPVVILVKYVTGLV
jgi:hypothetical protein